MATFDLLGILSGEIAPEPGVNYSAGKTPGLFAPERVAAMVTPERKRSAWEEYMIDRRIMDEASKHNWC